MALSKGVVLFTTSRKLDELVNPCALAMDDWYGVKKELKYLKLFTEDIIL